MIKQNFIKSSSGGTTNYPFKSQPNASIKIPTQPAVNKPAINKTEVNRPVINEPAIIEKPAIKKQEYQVKYRKVVYLGVSERAIRVGAVTGTQYVFTKNKYGMQVPVDIDERDYAGIMSEKGKGCARRSPEILFMSDTEWNLELEQARIANS